MLVGPGSRVLIILMRMLGERKARVSPEAPLARGFPRGKATGNVHRARKRIRKFTGSCSERCRDLTHLRPLQLGIAPTARQRWRSRRGERLETSPDI